MGNSAASSHNRPGPDATAGLLLAYHRRGDTAARERLIELYLPLVRTLARRYARGGADYEDLVQVGSIGLIKAIDRFDLERGGELASYAVPNITGEIRRHLRDSGDTVRLPRGLAELRARVPRARERLTARLGREPTNAELANEVEADENALALALEPRRVQSADEAAVETVFVDEDERLTLADAFEGLDERERRIIHLRFERDLDPDEVARELGISRRHLSRQTQAALSKLRRQLEGAPSAEPLPAKSGGSNLPEVDSRPAQDSAQYLDRPYHIVLVREGDDEHPQGWTASVEELPGCEAHADTADDATRAIRARMEAWIAEALAGNREIPEPRDASSYSGRLMLRMPQSLHAELAHAAERDDVSLNQFITGSLAGAVGWRQADRAEPTAPVEEEPGDAGAPPERRPMARGRSWLGKAMVANAVLLVVVGCVAVALLVFAVVHG